MVNKSKEIYAKEQQIKLIDLILQSLCSIELTSDGRSFLRKMKKKIGNDLTGLRALENKRNEPNLNFKK